MAARLLCTGGDFDGELSLSRARTVIVTNEMALGREDVRIPVAAHTVSGFRSWAHSGRFPEAGRIDFIGADVELDTSPEDLHTHGTPKAAP